MWPDRVLNPGPLALESDMLPTAPHGPARVLVIWHILLKPDFMILLQMLLHCVIAATYGSLSQSLQSLMPKNYTNSSNIISRREKKNERRRR